MPVHSLSVPPFADGFFTALMLRDPWTFEMVTHEGPFFKDGYFIIQDKPGLGVDLNPDIVKAHLAPDEVWWG